MSDSPTTIAQKNSDQKGGLAKSALNNSAPGSSKPDSSKSSKDTSVKTASVKSLRGMYDVLPTQIATWHYLENCVREVMRGYGYAELRTPLVERSALFHRGIGEVTDIVEKEMYTFLDRKQESLSLRPEATASCVRAALEHGLLQPGASHRIWYQGPMFRYERPQKGRARQFHQVGAEVYGIPGPAIEAELILLSARLWKMMRIDEVVQLEINTLGNTDDRFRYRGALVDYFSDHLAELDEDSVRRLQSNPLRILDSKNPALGPLLAETPQLADYLCAESAEHFSQLCELLEAADVKPVINPRLVRGLDYYSHTVFEWTTDRLGAQSAVCAGGRYDGLVEQLGGKPCPGVGWAMGMERLIALLELLHPEAKTEHPDVYVIVADDIPAHQGLLLAEWLRDQVPGLSVMQSTSAGSLKSQFKRADKSAASFAAVLGATELDSNSLTLKPLRGGGEQQTGTRQEIAQFLVQVLKSA